MFPVRDYPVDEDVAEADRLARSSSNPNQHGSGAEEQITSAVVEGVLNVLGVAPPGMAPAIT